MGDERKRPYYDRSLSDKAKREAAEAALKTAFNFGKTLITIPINLVIDGVEGAASVAVEYKPKKK